jgi:hypothetical protein
MENTLRNIRLMTAIERKLCALQFNNLIMDVWNLLGCDYVEILDKVYRVTRHEDIIENIIPELRYEFQCNQLMKYNLEDIFNFLLKGKDGSSYIVNNWDMLDNSIIIKHTIDKVIKEIIEPTIKEVLKQPLEECNYKIND